jgi:hypothetical protein
MDSPLFPAHPAATPVGEYAINNDKVGISISTQQRLDLALTEPTHKLALTQGQAKKVTQNRIRSAMAELAHGKIDKVNRWLDEVSEKEPARAIELFMQLAEFSLPKLKAVSIDLKSSDGNVKNYTVAQLEAMVNGQDDPSVIAEQ